MLKVQNVRFIKSAAGPEDFISDGLPQVVFAGKSNVGKSSVINRLLNRKNFARVGSAPGRTAHVNYYLVDGRVYLVDLPGYGYAKVSHAEKKRWGGLMEAFFRNGSAVSMGVLIVDARHAPTDDDRMMSDWFKSTGRPLVVLANKSDKLKSSELTGRPLDIRQALNLGEEAPVYLFSAKKGTGREALIYEIEKYVN